MNTGVNVRIPNWMREIVCVCTWRSLCIPRRSSHWSESQWLCLHTHHRSVEHYGQTHLALEWMY